MKLLILTQKVDKNDGGLGFFHAWIEKLAGRFEAVTVICLQEGQHSLPGNVRVLSLGKEKEPALSRPRRRYVFNFYKYIWRERKNYNAVFVHMNQEYVLLGGLFWRLAGKKIVLWRNHPLGSFLTTIAVGLSDKVLCASPYSYTARFKKTSVMPVGIDTEVFKPKVSKAGDENVPTRKNKILFFGRVSPVKKPDILVDAIRILKNRGVEVSTDIVGPIYEVDMSFAENLKTQIKAAGLEHSINFLPAITPAETPGLLSSYKLYVNATPTGSMDKTIFEAMACGTLVAVSNKALQDKIPEQFLFNEGDATDLARVIENLMKLSDEQTKADGTILRRYVVDHHSLNALVEKLTHEL